MALKKRLTDHEKHGLSEEEIKLAEKFLRKHRTAGALKELEAAKLFELFLLGESLTKIAQQFNFSLGQVALTAALRGWCYDRDRMVHTLQDRVRAKVVKSVLDQTDFLTAMMSVVNAEHLEKMMRYCHDPINNPKPDMRIESIKDYKDVTETLYKIVAGATSSGSKDGKKTSPMFEALTPQLKKYHQEKEEEKELEKNKELSILDVEDIGNYS
jgi:uncharacterized protein with HEPN domain